MSSKNNFTLINRVAGYCGNDNDVVISVYTNDIIEIIQVEYYNSVFDLKIEWYKSNKICNEIYKMINWLVKHGSKIELGETYYRLISTKFTDKKNYITQRYFTNPFEDTHLHFYEVMDFNDDNISSFENHLKNSNIYVNDAFE